MDQALIVLQIMEIWTSISANWRQRIQTEQQVRADARRVFI
jgi:hypothetical protein